MTNRSPVAAVILAAGLGRRFGSPKVVAQLGGQTLLLRVSRLAREAGLKPIIAVVPRGAETPSRVEAVVNTDPARGLSSSLRLGIAAVPANRAALVLLVDQPTMPRETISAVLAARGRRPLVVATADDRYGPPVLIEPEAFDLVSDLHGDIGLRDLLVSRPDLVESVEVPAHAPDVDTAADLDRLEDKTRAVTIERVGSAEVLEDERSLEATVRPRRLDEFAGQERIKENLAILIDAARQRSEPVDHILLYGPPGLGKTTLATIVAAEVGAQLRTTSGPAIERAGDLAAILTGLQRGDVLFIDEIHRLSHVVEEVLYPAMEDFVLDIVLGKGPGARTVRLQIEPITIIGATTRVGSITGPLRDRFGVTHRLDYYTDADLVTILDRSAGILEIPLDGDAAELIARRSRGTPRIANRLLKRVRDYAQVRGDEDGKATAAASEAALGLLDIDERGLDALDRQLLTAIAEHHGGGPVGLQTMAATISEPVETIEDVVEPYLIQAGLLARTPRGRQLTPSAWTHLGLTPPTQATIEATPQPGLFD